MNNNTKLTAKYIWQRLKAYFSRLFTMVKFICVAGLVGLVLVISNYEELRAFVLSFLDEKTVVLIKDMAQLFYGSSSILFALEQTFILAAMPAIGFLVRAICTLSFVWLVIWLLCCVAKLFVCDWKVVLPARSQCEHPVRCESKYLTLCKFIS